MVVVFRRFMGYIRILLKIELMDTTLISSSDGSSWLFVTPKFSLQYDVHQPISISCQA